MPGLVLACFNGGGQARLTDLRGPAIVNLWASWCPPCRTELPAFQDYAERAQGQVRMVGVVTKDRRDTAQSFIDDKRLTFPMLEDREQRLLTAVGKTALPVTLFVSGDGRIAYVYNSTALDESSIELMAQQYLGVVRSH